MLLQSMIIAFSMYSKIPMPRVEWNSKNMKYALCFFPLVGMVSGAILWGVEILLFRAGCGNLLIASVGTVLPLLITGGIHMDGFLDTIDALSSYGDRDKKLAILKDSHSGAFAITYGLVYIVLSLGIWSEVSQDNLPYIAVTFILSRTLSGFSVAAFPLAKNTGLAATFQDGAHRQRVKWIMGGCFLLESILLLLKNPVCAAGILLAAVAAFAWYAYVCRKQFGGITGDLAGYFLQIAELGMLGAVAFLR